MFYGKYTHIREIIEGVRRDFGFEEVYDDEVKEWVWDSLGFIGVLNIYEDKTTEITIEDYRGLMPTDLVYLEGIREQETGIMLIPSSSLFLSQNNTSTSTSAAYLAGVSLTNVSTPDDVGDRGDLEVNYAFAEIYPDASSLSSNSTIGYQIKQDYIICELNSGTLEVSYKAFPMWDDYTPKIPDDPKVIRMVRLYIAERIAFRLMLQDKLSERKYDMIKQDYYFAIGSARNRLLTPDVATMEFIKRMQLRHIPKIDAFKNGFNTLGEQERLR